MRPPPHLANGLILLTAGPDNGSPAPDQSRPPAPPQRGIGAAWLMAGSMALGVGLGLALDRHFGTSPRWTIGMSMLFLVVGVYQTIREANR